MAYVKNAACAAVTYGRTGVRWPRHDGAQPAAIPKIDASHDAHRSGQIDCAAPRALAKLDTGLRREALSVPKRDFDVVHLEVAAGDFDLDRRESPFVGAHDDGVVIEREAHAPGAQQFPVGGRKRQENESGKDGAHTEASGVRV